MRKYYHESSLHSKSPALCPHQDLDPKSYRNNTLHVIKKNFIIESKHNCLLNTMETIQNTQACIFFSVIFYTMLESSLYNHTATKHNIIFINH
ncbi:hypothetical protein LS77_000815 [Helicobacter bilis]|uniref:Uncharacterized protein n=1 Tax=Helicobacter bilis TaxID=37372 RepID=A0A6D2CK85_9HELI|nr:hypothetical protein [Helicobacter bilis]TLE06258.1 hypothetical protein LS77_000815 [Helicobacter bilis]TLE07105.1 hypothetical protein LS76_000140 [Helicobacter bilis]